MGAVTMVPNLTLGIVAAAAEIHDQANGHAACVEPRLKVVADGNEVETGFLR